MTETEGGENVGVVGFSGRVEGVSPAPAGAAAAGVAGDMFFSLLFSSPPTPFLLAVFFFFLGFGSVYWGVMDGPRGFFLEVVGSLARAFTINM